MLVSISFAKQISVLIPDIARRTFQVNVDPTVFILPAKLYPVCDLQKENNCYFQ